ncbi:MAG: hypothetical protein ACI9WU_003228 [Myxococcota bacterium]
MTLLGLVLVQAALAHGPAPAGIDVVVSSGGEAQIVKLARGLASRQTDGWRFICDAAWGGPETPRMAADAAGLWVAGTEGLSRLNHGGAAEITSDALNAASVRDIVRLGDEAFALTGFSGGSTIWRLEEAGPEAIVLSPLTIQSLRSDARGPDGDSLLFVVSDETNTVVRRVDRSGAPTGDELVFERIEGSLALRPTRDGTLYLRSQVSAHYTLWRLDALPLEVATSEDPFHGPIVVDGTTLLTVDRRLAVLTGDSAVVLGETRDLNRVTCLGLLAGGTGYACVLPDIVPVSATGFADPPVFALRDIQLPDYDAFAPELAVACEVDWLDLASDAGLSTDVPFDPGPASPEADAGVVVSAPPTESSSCSRGPGTPYSIATLCALLLALLVARRRAIQCNLRVSTDTYTM